MTVLPRQQPVKMTLEQVMEGFNIRIREAEVFLRLARASHLQLEQCFALDSLMHNATRLKHEAIRFSRENDANAFLGLECVIGAVRAELMTLILLKRDMPNEAWNRLIAAEMACLDAMRAHIGFSNCSHRLELLKQMEHQFFPQQTFLSAGFVSDRIDCSICGERYSTCKHLRGKAYMGQFCEVIHRNIRADHMALVEIPADKRCRITSFKVKEGHRDKLSWEITPFKDGEAFTEGPALEAQSILLAVDRYPYMASTEEILGTRIDASSEK